MTTTSIGRRARCALALAAGAAVLGMSACGVDGGESAGSGPGTAVEGSDGGGASDSGSASGSDSGSDSGSESGSDSEDGAGADEGAGEDGDDPGASKERTRIVLATDYEMDETSGDGIPTLEKEKLEALLGDRFEATAECTEGLPLSPGYSVICMGPVSVDRTEPTQEWVANVVMVPSEEGLENGTQAAVLFSTGTELPEEASALMDESISVTGVGFGSAFGMEPLSAEELAESTLQTLTSEFAYIPVNEAANWSEVTCDDGMDFAQFATVDCTATTAEGESWHLKVAPGTYADNDQGLLVGISVFHDGNG